MKRWFSLSPALSQRERGQDFLSLWEGIKGRSSRTLWLALLVLLLALPGAVGRGETAVSPPPPAVPT
ncbi:MAG: hypothetical protein KC425_27765, partial [Anaerolineales bacterium]|nr:hypothetical protein [Anaerolineales bacterium]